MTTTAPARPSLRRASDDRVVAGVCRGVADHLGVDVWVVRAVFVLLAFSNLAGVVGYAALWVLTPLDDDEASPAVAEPDEEKERRVGPLLALGLVAGAVVLGIELLGVSVPGGLTLPVVVVGVGVAVLWRVADDAQRDRWRAVATTHGDGRRSWLRLAGGVALVALGIGALLLTRGGIAVALEGLAATAVVLVGTALVVGPWLYRLVQEARRERLERIRTQERAELAAHVHDSVLQTLTLVRRHADDPREVVRLARAEERALRAWLYEREPAHEDSFRAGLDRVVADVEALHGGTVEAVVVGDAPMDARLAALLQAAREAVVNAVNHAGHGGPVSVYAEVSDDEAAVFVRDRGDGFDPAAVPPDRHGVRESVIGRMERHGGRAVIRTAPGTGTEVELVMPREQS